jgi:hypothetical protein
VSLVLFLNLCFLFLIGFPSFLSLDPMLKAVYLQTGLG